MFSFVKHFSAIIIPKCLGQRDTAEISENCTGIDLNYNFRAQSGGIRYVSVAIGK